MVCYDKNMFMPERVFSAQSLEESGLYEVPSPEAVESFRADLAVDLMVDHVQHIYLPFRGQEGYGTERAIFIAPQHVPHRENDAEHSWHVEDVGLRLYQNRSALRMPFPKGFSLLKFMLYFHDHDLGEINCPDVDATALDPTRSLTKKADEHVAWEKLGRDNPYMSDAVENGLRYEEKLDYESQLASDIEKSAATIVIAVDGGHKWHKWGYDSTTRDRMFRIYRNKMITPVGFKLWQAVEGYLVERPELFPEVEYIQDRLF
jgi:hypothetical protein